jgi:hypothetical protein
VELSALADRIDIEISRWRSKDTGGENGYYKNQILFSFITLNFCMF